MPIFFFQISVFFKLFSALCVALYGFFSLCIDFVQIFFPVDIKLLFSVLLLPEVPIVLTNVLNKNYIKIKFLQKIHWEHVFISSRSGARGHQRFVNFEIVHWNSMFTLELNAVVSTDYIEKCFHQKISKIEFPTKTLLSAYVYLP